MVMLAVVPARANPPREIRFDAPAGFAIGPDLTYPTAAAVGDFNNDGIADLAVTEPNSSLVSIMMGVGDGTFWKTASYAVNVGPVFVAVSDFNNDGVPDLAVVNGGFASSGVGASVSILLGNGDGTFQPATNYLAGLSPQSLAIGDFNWDGNAELAVANYGSGTVSILLGDGTGSFRLAENLTVGGNPQSVAAADLNRDGKLDLAVTNGPLNIVSILLGNGDGTFQQPVPYGGLNFL